MCDGKHVITSKALEVMEVGEGEVGWGGVRERTKDRSLARNERVDKSPAPMPATQIRSTASNKEPPSATAGARSSTRRYSAPNRCVAKRFSARATPWQEAPKSQFLRTATQTTGHLRGDCSMCL